MNKLRMMRERMGWSQKKLAKAIKSHQPRIADWEKEPGEKGWREIPIDKARELTVVLDCLLTDLRPDLKTAKSIDVLLEGAPSSIQDDVRDYAIYKLNQRR